MYLNMMIKSILFLFLVIFVNASQANDIDRLKTQYQRPSTIPFPEDNPYSAEKAMLGKMLFFDPRLSKHQNLSCASCHNPSFGWEGALARSVGTMNTELGRHSPTSLNMAWGKTFFWDGRAKTLEEQALGPIQSDVEMGLELTELESRLKNIDGYNKLFSKVFNDGITSDNVAKAIATFERTVVSGVSPFDLWIEGDEGSISESAKKGFVIFNNKGRCASCHQGWNFTDNKFHDIGIDTEDEGRYLIDSSSEKNRYAFKTPGLRNIAQRSPYMHTGDIKTLQSVINHYIMGGEKRPSLSKDMQPIMLSNEEIEQLTDFLNTLQGDDRPMSLPILPL